MLITTNSSTISVGIPNILYLRIIDNVDKAAWDDGYASDGKKVTYVDYII